jgi:hypothetical protein
LDPASAEVIAKRETKVRTKIIEINFFTIANPSFRSNFSFFTFLDEGSRGFIQTLEYWNSGIMEDISLFLKRCEKIDFRGEQAGILMKF